MLATDNGLIPTPFSSAFHTCAINKHPFINSIHTDGNEFITGVFIGGKNFEGGALVFPQINLRLLVHPGDIIWCFEDLIHYVEPVTCGVRNSLTLYSKHISYSCKGRILQFPEQTKKILNFLNQ
jgi:hypothetical protein